jgi:hypothetical protein
MEHNRPPAINIFSAGQYISRLLQNPKVYFRVHKISSVALLHISKHACTCILRCGVLKPLQNIELIKLPTWAVRDT